MNPDSFTIPDSNSGFKPNVPNPSVSASDIAEDRHVIIEVAYINARTGFLKLSVHVAEDLISLNEDLDFAGLQRQLRILGTLARLHVRDGKSFRLPDLKQTLIYVIETSNKYDGLKEFSQLLKSKVQPALEENLGGIND